MDRQGGVSSLVREEEKKKRANSKKETLLGPALASRVAASSPPFIKSVRGAMPVHMNTTSQPYVPASAAVAWV
jgi:hypothetical protein